MRKALSLIFTLLISACVYAQSADVVTEILESNEISYGQAAYLSACHQNIISDDAGYEEALQILISVGQVSSKVSPEDAIRGDELAEIYLQMWPEIKAGFMYRLTKGAPRYAFKKLKSDGIVDEKADPSKTLSGIQALNILTACMLEYGSEEESMSMDLGE